MSSPTTADQALSVLFSALDDANLLLELGQFDAAKSRLDEAHELAGMDSHNRLLVTTARLCLLVELDEHANAVSLIDQCLEQCDSLSFAPDNDSLRTDLLVQRALSLCELQRWAEALATFRRPGIPQDSPKLQFHVRRCLRALEHTRSAREYFVGSHGAEIAAVPKRSPSLALLGL